MEHFLLYVLTKQKTKNQNLVKIIHFNEDIIVRIDDKLCELVERMSLKSLFQFTFIDSFFIVNFDDTVKNR